MKLGKMFKNVKRHLRAFKKYWLATERYPRFVIPMIFFIFAATSLTTTFAVMPLLSNATAGHTQTVYISEDDTNSDSASEQAREECNSSSAASAALSCRRQEITEVAGTTYTTEQDTVVETPEQIETATNPSTYRASVRTTTTTTTAKTTTPVTTSAPTTTTTNTINIDQNRAADTPTDIVNPTPDDVPTDIPDEDML